MDTSFHCLQKPLLNKLQSHHTAIRDLHPMLVAVSTLSAAIKIGRYTHEKKTLNIKEVRRAQESTTVVSSLMV